MFLLATLWGKKRENWKFENGSLVRDCNVMKLYFTG